MDEWPRDFSDVCKAVIELRYLTIVIGASQVVGATLGDFVGASGDPFLRSWTGGALATFPAFLLGLVNQEKARPNSISSNRAMVNRLGIIAVILTLAALFV